MYLKNKDAIIHVRVSSSLRDHLREVAKKHGMSLSVYLRFVIGYQLSLESEMVVSDMYEDE